MRAFTLLFLLAITAACRAPAEGESKTARDGEVLPSEGESRAGEPADGGAAPRESADRGSAPRRRPFVALEYDPYRADGAGSIAGQAFLRTRGGDVKFGAGCIVHLTPVTSYSGEWFEREIQGGERLEPADARADHYHWTTRADGFGGFAFERLPPGDYYLACRIVWDIHDDRGAFTPAGGWAFAKVSVGEGLTRAVVTR